MPELKDEHKVVDPIKRDLENTSLSRPEWALDHSSPRKLDNSGSHPIPESFFDAIMEVIAKTIEKVLAEVMARCVAEGVEQKIRPLAGEIALLRIAIEHDWDSANRRRRNSPHDEEDCED